MGVLNGVACDARKVNPAMSYGAQPGAEEWNVAVTQQCGLCVDLDGDALVSEVRFFLVFFCCFFFLRAANYNYRANVANVLAYIF